MGVKDERIGIAVGPELKAELACRRMGRPEVNVSEPNVEMETAAGETNVQIGWPVRRTILLAVTLGILVLLYAKPLFALFRFAAGSSLYSHILMVPFVSGYFVWLRRRKLVPFTPSVLIGLFPLALGFALLAAYWTGLCPGTNAFEGRVGIMAASFLCLLYGILVIVLGWENFRCHLFWALFLLFIVPFPPPLLTWIETGLQHGSAYFAHALFSASGIPVLREGTLFQLPGIRLQVAPECSGIHSTLVLLITSIVAGQFFLKTPLHRAILALAIIPLALLRNGFRIFTIGQLCVHYGPQMLDSYIHHRGGPIFFALSLLPFLFLLLFLVKSERKWARVRSERVPRTSI